MKDSQYSKVESVRFGNCNYCATYYIECGKCDYPISLAWIKTPQYVSCEGCGCPYLIVDNSPYPHYRDPDPDYQVVVEEE